jgi:cytosine/adenosine deaminase-related metal-dependent hydrolase
MTKTLIRGGTIVSMDPTIGDLPQGDVLIDGERIAAIAEYYQRPFDEIKDTLRRNGRTLQIREELKEQKVLNCLIGEAAWA